MIGRRQAVWPDNILSDFISVDIGVPQGSLMGPLLINIFVNDMFDRRGEMSDDTCFLHGGGQLLRVQPPRLSIHWRTRVGEQMMADTMTWLRGGESVGGEHVRKFGE